MKIKLTKENNTMPEVTGVKVKDFNATPSVDNVESETTSVEETITEEQTTETPVEEITDAGEQMIEIPEGEIINPTPEVVDNQPAADVPMPDLGGLMDAMFNTAPTEEQPAPDPMPAEEPVVEYKKVATARLIDYNGTTIYRFDIFNKEFGQNSGIVEFRNVVNGFNSARPNNKKDYKDFFAMFGIITWNFSATVMPYEKNILALVTELESLINEHIGIAGIKKGKFEFKIDIVEDYKV